MWNGVMVRPSASSAELWAATSAEPVMIAKMCRLLLPFKQCSAEVCSLTLLLHICSCIPMYCPLPSQAWAREGRPPCSLSVPSAEHQSQHLTRAAAAKAFHIDPDKAQVIQPVLSGSFGTLPYTKADTTTRLLV